jgi:uncharacterized protein YndB with AHSA1/START domain
MAELLDRGVITKRVFPHDRSVVYSAWTNPELVTQWWGPAGFTDTLIAHDLRPDGEWRHILHGPDGTEYPNLAIFTDVVPPERLGFRHYTTPEPQGEPNYTNLTMFELVPSGTRVSMRMLFASPEHWAMARDVVVPKNEENFDKLGALLGRLQLAGA